MDGVGDGDDQEEVRSEVEVEEDLPSQVMQAFGQMTLPAKVEYFQPGKGKWRRWLMRLEETFECFGVFEEEQKRRMLNHYLGSEAYDKLCDRISPRIPKDLKYAEIVREMTECFDPEPLEIVEVYHFQMRKQAEGESCDEYLAALRKLSTKCNFGEFLAKALRNQFVVGLRNKTIQQRLLEKRELTLELALDIAKAMESSELGEEVIQQRKQEINKVSATQRSSTTKETTSNDAEDASKRTRRCFKCGSTSHLSNRCNREVTCYICNKSGHISTFCYQKNSKGGAKAQDNEKLNRVEDIMYLESTLCKKICLPIRVKGKAMIFEVDSGSPISIIGMRDKDKFWPNEEILPSRRNFVGYDDNKIEIAGFIRVNIEIEGRRLQGQNLYVSMALDKTPLLGREWIQRLNWLNWNEVMQIHKVSEMKDVSKYVDELKKEFQTVFEDSMGRIEGFQGELKLQDDCKPIFLRARNVPFALRESVENEIKSLVKDGVLVKVNQSRWATPVVAIPKSSGRVRLCGDYSCTVNPRLIIDKHPLPTTEELLSDLAGGERFSKIDLSQAYLQLEVREEDREILTLSTHKGLYRPTRLMYGVASAVAIWQRMMESLLLDIPGVKVFLDDIRITGSNDEEHFDRLKEVFRRLKSKNMRVNFGKCEFFADKISYCGYVIDKQGIHKDPKKVEALEEMPRPTNKDEVRAYTGFVNYYGRFFPHLSTKLHPINDLLKKKGFHWNKHCEKAFREIKKEMSSDKVLAHFDEKQVVVVAVDASPVGVGACLGHRYEDGTERPVNFASQTLTDTQKKYTQLDKEAYAIIFGLKKFFSYLWGRKFVLIVDNKPLSQIMNPVKGLPHYSALRMQHYAMYLRGFDFEVEHRKTELHGNADGLSRLPLNNISTFETDEPELVQIGLINALPVLASEIAKETALEVEVRELMMGLKDGKFVKKESRFGIPMEEFSFKHGCLVRGIRTYIPKKLRCAVLNELHEGHMGVVKMKLLARSYCWWPNVDKDIEQLVLNCTNCQEIRAEPPKAPIHLWENAKEAFQRIHIDYAGPICGKWLLIVVDAYSKWPEVAIVSDMTALTTIDELRKIFATHGVPEEIISDQGRQFMSWEFREFCKSNGIVHKTGAPYHPATNGQAERRTPHSATGESPSQRLYKRQIRSRLDLLIPKEVTKKENVEGLNLKGVRSLEVGDRVAARNYRVGEAKWRFGNVETRFGQLHYNIVLDNGVNWKRHIDQLRKVGSNAGLNQRQVGQSYWDVDTSNSDLPYESVEENFDGNNNEFESASIHEGGVSGGEDEEVEPRVEDEGGEREGHNWRVKWSVVSSGGVTEIRRGIKACRPVECFQGNPHEHRLVLSLLGSIADDSERFAWDFDRVFAVHR
ncbi:uncharacterized protein K02A2.6-like [Phlebotomus argentipes]|uniref:uncharacterized protein K02A2.6-like n=1 Tax=Phlebotomus argentipes TaxID=94469 RepID=UPI0028930AF3|nr:uncharacterized protein K02A2.6-like [Phlebotomus argentipes]